MRNIIVLCFLSILFVVSCNKYEPIGNLQENKNVDLDTIPRLTDMKSNKAIWNDNGIYRTVTIEESTDPKEFEDESVEKATCSNAFSGLDRAVAKKSFSSATQYTYGSFNAFKNTLPTDAFMRSLGIPRSSTSDRVSQENRNMYIKTSYLYAIKRESDGDLHMIIGDNSQSALINCEASGYPATVATSYPKIKAVKEAIVARFSTDFCGKSSYTIFSPPVLITGFKGSLFFDVDHSAGTVGPAAYRPTTAWEVHPISYIKF
jgi:hypothetical protein